MKRFHWVINEDWEILTKWELWTSLILFIIPWHTHWFSYTENSLYSIIDNLTSRDAGNGAEKQNLRLSSREMREFRHLNEGKRAIGIVSCSRWDSFGTFLHAIKSYKMLSMRELNDINLLKTKQREDITMFIFRAQETWGSTENNRKCGAKPIIHLKALMRNAIDSIHYVRSKVGYF